MASPLHPPTRVLLVRHAQSVWNAERRWQGQADPDLSDLGRRQAVAAAEAVGLVDAIVASDLRRALHTAGIIGELIGIGPVVPDPRLRERAAGPWEGLTLGEIERDWPGWVDAGRRPEGYEHDGPVAERAIAALRAVHAQLPGGAVLVVSHGGVIHAVAHACGQPEGRHIPNLGGRWYEVDASGLRPGEPVVLIDHAAVAATVPEAE
jgi:probable phosphoglycerate mutase